MTSTHMILKTFIFIVMVFVASYGIAKTAQTMAKKYGPDVSLIITWSNVLLSAVILFLTLGLFVGAIH